MNLKLNNEQNTLKRSEPLVARASIKEERRRTGRYIAILVGMSLLFLALYQAWVRNIPVVASLIVPALIMFIYIAWVLYTASRDKRNKARDLERGMIELISPTTPSLDADEQVKHDSDPLNNTTAPAIYDKFSPQITQPVNCINDSKSLQNNSNDGYHNCEERTNAVKTVSKEDTVQFTIKPVILVNDQPHVEHDDHENQLSKELVNFRHDKVKTHSPHVFKRSYSIA